jgi:hypothetical protein
VRTTNRAWYKSWEIRGKRHPDKPVGHLSGQNNSELCLSSPPLGEGICPIMMMLEFGGTGATD